MNALSHAERLAMEDIAKLPEVRDSLRAFRAGYARALADSGPKPTTAAMAARMKADYAATAYARFPDPTESR